MAQEQKQEAVSRKRQPKNGNRRVVVELTAEEYQTLTKVSADQMREPNNMLSFALRGKISQLIETAAPQRMLHLE